MLARSWGSYNYVCPSDCPSHTRALWRNERTYCRYFDTTWKGSHSRYQEKLNQLARVADLPSRRIVTPTARATIPAITTVGRQTFPVLWNSFPSDIQASSSLSDFRQRLKNISFASFPDIDLWSHSLCKFVVHAIVYAILATLKKTMIDIDIDNASFNEGWWHLQSLNQVADPLNEARKAVGVIIAKTCWIWPWLIHLHN